MASAIERKKWPAAFFLLFLSLAFSSCQGTIFGYLVSGVRLKTSKASSSSLNTASHREIQPVSTAKNVSLMLKPSDKKSQEKVLAIYDEGSYREPSYIPAGRMGDWGDVRFDSLWEGGVEGSLSCIRIEYLARATQGNGWAGLYWQKPPGNWGHVRDGGRNLEGAKKLVFWARGETGREIISQFMMGGIQGKYPDTDHTAIGPIYLEKEWKRYEISLKGRDLRRIAGGFAWTAELADNPGGAVFYLDDIKYEW